MTSKSKSRAGKPGRTAAQQSNVINKENWMVNTLSYEEDCPVRGFLQMCADRRFGDSNSLSGRGQDRQDNRR